jgi:hypothetical protein
MGLTYDFTQLPVDGELPLAGGDWVLAAKARPGRNTSAVRAVDSASYHVAFPSICRRPDGELLIVYREGLTHAAGQDPRDGRVMLVRSSDQGATWSAPETIVDSDDWDDRNAAIACFADGTLLVCWDKWGQDPEGAYAHRGAWFIVSRDGGQTWTAPTRLEPVADVHTRSPALELRDGRWLIPLAEGEGNGQAAYGALVDPETFASEMVPITPVGDRNLADEVAVSRAADGSLVALGRTFNDCWHWQTRSYDEGRLWETPWLTAIPSAYAPCDLITLRDGRLLCTFSFRERREERVAISADNGATWDLENSLSVFDGRPPSMDRAYPASVQIDDHTVGTVLYETDSYPRGGTIYFVKTDLRQLEEPPVTCLYQPNPEAREARATLPVSGEVRAIRMRYRFTGKFGQPPHRIEIGLRERDGRGLVFGYQMGDTARREALINSVDIHQTVSGDRYHVLEQSASGEWFNDGLEHELTLRRTADGWEMLLDGIPQCAVASGFEVGELWLGATNATVAVYELAIE